MSTKHRISSRQIEMTPDEATEAVAHHLYMAAIFFEMTPDFQPTLEEILKLLAERNEQEACKAAAAWLHNINASYEAMKERD